MLTEPGARRASASSAFMRGMDSHFSPRKRSQAPAPPWTIFAASIGSTRPMLVHLRSVMCQHHPQGPVPGTEVTYVVGATRVHSDAGYISPSGATYLES